MFHLKLNDIDYLLGIRKLNLHQPHVMQKLILLNNLWRFMPEFHGLDVIFSVPLSLQVVFFVVSIFLGLVLYVKNGSSKLKISLLFGFTLILSIASWYQIIFSNNTNSLTVELYPFYQREVKFDIITTIKIEDRKMTLMTDSKILAIYTGFYPLGLNNDLLRKTLVSHGNCVQRSGNQCIEVEFASP